MRRGIGITGTVHFVDVRISAATMPAWPHSALNALSPSPRVDTYAVPATGFRLRVRPVFAATGLRRCESNSSLTSAAGFGLLNR